MTTFDDLDWHRAAAAERGQPPEHAFAHIALYLAWAIRNDLVEPSALPAALVAEVQSGSPGGPALRDAVGGRLRSDVLTTDGEAFTAWYYPRYLDDFATAFADAPPYSVVADAAATARIAPTIDRRHAEWLASSWAGEPDTRGIGGSGLTFSADELRAMTPADLEALAQELADAIAGSGSGSAAGDGRPSGGAGGGPSGGIGNARLSGSTGDRDLDPEGFDEAPAIPHAAPDLEALLPPAVAGTLLEISSARVTEWQSTLLRQAIEHVGADPGEALVAIGMGGTGDDTIVVTIYAIPGVAQDRLEAEFSRDIYLADGQSWELRDVDGKPVWWASADEFDTAFYALGGLIVTAGGSPDRVRAALEVLP